MMKIASSFQCDSKNMETNTIMSKEEDLVNNTNDDATNKSIHGVNIKKNLRLKKRENVLIKDKIRKECRKQIISSNNRLNPHCKNKKSIINNIEDLECNLDQERLNCQKKITEKCNKNQKSQIRNMETKLDNNSFANNESIKKKTPFSCLEKNDECVKNNSFLFHKSDDILHTNGIRIHKLEHSKKNGADISFKNDISTENYHIRTMNCKTKNDLSKIVNDQVKGENFVSKILKESQQAPNSKDKCKNYSLLETRKTNNFNKNSYADSMYAFNNDMFNIKTEEINHQIIKTGAHVRYDNLKSNIDNSENIVESGKYFHKKSEANNLQYRNKQQNITDEQKIICEDRIESSCDQEGILIPNKYTDNNWIDVKNQFLEYKKTKNNYLKNYHNYEKSESNKNSKAEDQLRNGFNENLKRYKNEGNKILEIGKQESSLLNGKKRFNDYFTCHDQIENSKKYKHKLISMKEKIDNDLIKDKNRESNQRIKNLCRVNDIDISRQKYENSIKDTIKEVGISGNFNSRNLINLKKEKTHSNLDNNREGFSKYDYESMLFENIKTAKNTSEYDNDKTFSSIDKLQEIVKTKQNLQGNKQDFFKTWNYNSILAENKKSYVEKRVDKDNDDSIMEESVYSDSSLTEKTDSENYVYLQRRNSCHSIGSNLIEYSEDCIEKISFTSLNHGKEKDKKKIESAYPPKTEFHRTHAFEPNKLTKPQKCDSNTLLRHDLGRELNSSKNRGNKNLYSNFFDSSVSTSAESKNSLRPCHNINDEFILSKDLKSLVVGQKSTHKKSQSNDNFPQKIMYKNECMDDILTLKKKNLSFEKFIANLINNRSISSVKSEKIVDYRGKEQKTGELNENDFTRYLSQMINIGNSKMQFRQTVPVNNNDFSNHVLNDLKKNKTPINYPGLDTAKNIDINNDTKCHKSNSYDNFICSKSFLCNKNKTQEEKPLYSEQQMICSGNDGNRIQNKYLCDLKNHKKLCKNFVEKHLCNHNNAKSLFDTTKHRTSDNQFRCVSFHNFLNCTKNENTKYDYKRLVYSYDDHIPNPNDISCKKIGCSYDYDVKSTRKNSLSHFSMRSNERNAQKYSTRSDEAESCKSKEKKCESACCKILRDGNSFSNQAIVKEKNTDFKARLSNNIKSIEPNMLFNTLYDKGKNSPDNNDCSSSVKFGCSNNKKKITRASKGSSSDIYEYRYAQNSVLAYFLSNKTVFDLKEPQKPLSSFKYYSPEYFSSKYNNSRKRSDLILNKKDNTKAFRIDIIKQDEKRDDFCSKTNKSPYVQEEDRNFLIEEECRMKNAAEALLLFKDAIFNHLNVNKNSNS